MNYGDALDEKYMRSPAARPVLPAWSWQVESGIFDLYQRIIIGTGRFTVHILDDGGVSAAPQAPVPGPHDHIDELLERMVR
jgi:hypothetical protein